MSGLFVLQNGWVYDENVLQEHLERINYNMKNGKTASDHMEQAPNPKALYDDESRRPEFLRFCKAIVDSLRKENMSEDQIKMEIAHHFNLMHRQQFFRDGNTRCSFYLLFYFFAAHGYKVQRIEDVLEAIPMWTNDHQFTESNEIQRLVRQLNIEEMNEDMSEQSAQNIYTEIMNNWQY